MDGSWDITLDLRDEPRVGVLIVESDPSTARDLMQALERFECLRVEVCSTIDAALDVTHRSNPEVVLLDLDLAPDPQIVARLVGTSRTRRIIALVERSQEGLARARAAKEAGAWGTIYKDGWIDRVSAQLEGLTVTTGPDESLAETILESSLSALADNRARDFETLVSIANALEWRESGGRGEAVSVADLAVDCLAEADPQLAANPDVKLGFVLHDIGKIAVPDQVLTKRGPLSSSEWNLVRGHPTFGAELVKDNRLDPAALSVIQCHHERWDGTGYPNGLSRDETPLTARIFAVADAYTAMTSERPYRAAMSHGDAAQIIKWHAAKVFDPDAVDVLLKVIGEAKDTHSYA